MPTITADDLVVRLLAEAERAIRREAGSLAFDTGRVRGVTLDFSVTGHGVVAARVYVERQAARGGRE